MNGTLEILLAPETVVSGDTFIATFKVTNTGTETMPAAGTHPVSIGSQSPQDNVNWDVSRVSLPADLAPGALVTFDASCVARVVAGTYQFAWKLVQEYVGWFDMAIVSQTLVVTGTGGTTGEGDYAPGYPVYGTAPDARLDGSLTSFLAFNTGPYPADSTQHTIYWTNDTGRELSICKAYLWTGVDRSAIADVHAELRRDNDGSYIAILQWDHYADPTLPQHAQQFEYPSPMTLMPDEKLRLFHFANGFSTGWHAHHLVILWVK